MPSAPTFLFAGGGTGGHLYPGLAIAEALRSRASASNEPAPRCLFICSTRPIDASILRAEGTEFEPLRAEPFGVHPKRLLRFLLAWRGSVSAAERMLERERAASPRIVVAAMGGFVAAPVVAAAMSMRIPIALVNLDAAPGKANRWIASRATVALSATGESEKVPSQWRRIAPIVRSAALPRGTPDACRGRLGLREATPTLFVSGGSQGATSINALLMRLASTRADAFAGWQVFHQTGERDAAPVAEAYRNGGVSAVVVPFCAAMGDAWGASDLAVARGGAGTVGEAWASATPTVFLPYPYHRDEHQRWNARPLEVAGGALIVRDRIDPSANEPDAGEALVRLLRDAPARARMRDALQRLGPADGARAAAEAIAGLTP